MSRELFRKPTNCKCGNYREAGDRWVVIERRKPPASSQLKCLECGWKWFNSRGYVKKLPDHTEDSRRGMTDNDVLERIREGTIFIDVNRASVFTFNSRDRKWKQLRIIERESNGSTYRFVEVCYKGKKKKVALHRLVWMFHNLELIPDGYDIDHKNGKRGENPDGIANLRLLESSVNRSKGCPSESMRLFDEAPF